jgi:formamidopyrimidine-DNA glycosylase
MPELPEVEIVMRALAGCLVGQRIDGAILRRQALRWPLPEGLALRLTGARVTGFRRRGKYLLMRLAGGDSLLIHLGMSGRVLVRRRGAVAADRHEHLTLTTEAGWEVGLIDPRRFGALDLLPTAGEDGHRLLARLGPEPLEAGFTAAALEDAVRGRRTAIKPLLLDQRVVAGLGNIYACEALFRARISPLRSAATVTGGRAVRLVGAVKATLRRAIAAGGSSLRDYVHPDGGSGHFQLACDVYGRAGQPCARCPGPPACAGIRRIVQSGRSTFYCERSQR